MKGSARTRSLIIRVAFRIPQKRPSGCRPFRSDQPGLCRSSAEPSWLPVFPRFSPERGVRGVEDGAPEARRSSAREEEGRGHARRRHRVGRATSCRRRLGYGPVSELREARYPTCGSRLRPSGSRAVQRLRPPHAAADTASLERDVGFEAQPQSRSDVPTTSASALGAVEVFHLTLIAGLSRDHRTSYAIICAPTRTSPGRSQASHESAMSMPYEDRIRTGSILRCRLSSARVKTADSAGTKGRRVSPSST